MGGAGASVTSSHVSVVPGTVVITGPANESMTVTDYGTAELKDNSRFDLFYEIELLKGA